MGQTHGPARRHSSGPSPPEPPWRSASVQLPVHGVATPARVAEGRWPALVSAAQATVLIVVEAWPCWIVTTAAVMLLELSAPIVPRVTASVAERSTTVSTPETPFVS